MAWAMNPKYGEMLEGGKSADRQDEGGAAKKEEHKRAGQHPPHIHVHSHSGGHTVHAMHHDGTHTKQDFALGDHQGVADHVQSILSGEGAAPEGHESVGEEMIPGGR